MRLPAPAARSMEWHLGVSCALLALPILGFVGWLLWQYTGAERLRLEREGAELLHTASASVERHLISQSALTELAGYSPPLQGADHAITARSLRELADALGIVIVLRDAAGRRLVHTSAPAGVVLAPDVRSEDAIALRTKRPVASNLHHDSLADAQLVSITAPVLRPASGDVAYLLSFGFAPERMMQAVANDVGASAQMVVIVDGEGRVIGSNRPHEAPTGRPLPGVTMYATGQGGRFRAAWTDGKPFIAHYARLSAADWIVLVGTKEKMLEAPLRRFFLQLALAGLALALLSLALAWAFGRRITGALSELRAGAAALGEGARVGPINTHVSQVNEVGAALRSAAAAIEEGRERQALLNRELHHRVKNNLATVQAVVRATGRHATSVESFRDTLMQRIGSLANTHDLLVGGEGGGVSLGKLLRNELQPYDDGVSDRIVLEGPPVELPADMALPLGMVLHELATNAAKYGALSKPSGALNVRWSVAPREGARWVDLEWKESGAPGCEAPSRRGFGSMLLDRVARQLDSTVEKVFEPDGLRVSIKAPLAALDAAAPSAPAAHGGRA